MSKLKAIGYIRVSSDKQDFDSQKQLLLNYSQSKQLLISEFIESDVSSKKDTKSRKIDILLEKLAPGDTLLISELSRLGRNMLETLNIINALSNKKIKIIFVQQPELSTTGPHTNLLLAIYSYFAEAERDHISFRTKQGLMAAKAKGMLLGRPKGSKNKKGRVLDPFKDQIKQFLELNLSISSIKKIIDNQLKSPITYNSFKYFIKHDDLLLKAYQKANTEDSTMS